MKPTLAFDVYGTLIDTQGVLDTLLQMMGEDAFAFSAAWRDKQLEYSFRRGLMDQYQDFSVCTRDALEFTCQSQQKHLSRIQKLALLEAYKTLPAFDDAPPALAALQQSGYPLFAFSNGSRAAVDQLLSAAGIIDSFQAIVSCEDVKSFKPNPKVYQHFLQTAQVDAQQAWLISSNPFDVIGAVAVNMKAAWVQRSQSQVFDPWDVSPTMTLESLHQLTHIES
ncbi:haloacid dehalogenase type II [Shewanella gelidii]|uniref:(S)-2-haloacid dehalogenase n=1 Tax=Shewanella gelidii TaxID=1642821 RepID=A0A917N7A5_9GAMM|nr:haloacid dehalogenase type II [Shewanella gelidii]MCL1096958.1 haloacid dehalogenase type II [Shewanella gelidii]GGI71496.1 hypothetical protein GCM10009332_06040 [Shewanella gelidii]